MGSVPIVNSCTVHNNNFVPGTHILLTTWYNSGTSVVDLSDPEAPVEIAHYNPDPTFDMDLTAYWLDGRVYVSDGSNGLAVLKIKGVTAKP